MFRLSPEQLIVGARTLAAMSVSEQFDGTTRRDPDIGQRVEAERTDSWDVRFIQHCGFWSHYDHKSRTSAWPIPQTVTTTAELAEFGEQHAILRETPRTGDIFLQYGPQRKAFVHSGIVVDVLASRQFAGKPPHFDLYTIEGDTDEFGRLHRGRAMRVRRQLSPELGDRFLRWPALECPGLRLVLDFSDSADTARRSA